MRTLLAFTLLSTLLACQKDQPAAKDPDVLQAYDVPEAQAAEIASLLRLMMAKAKDDSNTRIGYALASPNGRQVLVTAQKSYQASIAAWVEQLKNAPASTAQRRSIRLEYWVVQGKPAAERKQDKMLAPLQPALDALFAEYGPQELTFFDRASVTGWSGEKVQNQSARLEIVHTAVARGDVVDADIEMEVEMKGRPSAAGKVRARLTVPTGKFVVIGDAQAPAGGTLYYVVRASFSPL